MVILSPIATTDEGHILPDRELYFLLKRNRTLKADTLGWEQKRDDWVAKNIKAANIVDVQYDQAVKRMAVTLVDGKIYNLRMKVIRPPQIVEVMRFLESRGHTA